MVATGLGGRSWLTYPGPIEWLSHCYLPLLCCFEHPSDRLGRCISVARWILRQQLESQGLSPWDIRNDIAKRAPAVNGHSDVCHGEVVFARGNLLTQSPVRYSTRLGKVVEEPYRADILVALPRLWNCRWRAGLGRCRDPTGPGMTHLHKRQFSIIPLAGNNIPDSERPLLLTLATLLVSYHAQFYLVRRARDSYIGHSSSALLK